MKHLFIILAAVMACYYSCSCSYAPKACGPVPSQQQLDLMNMEMYAFIHYSLNTYTDQEWGYGNEDLSLFNPSNLDVHQWVETCKNAGMKGIIFTAKHHCGFCMWPSKYTDYSVKNTPWKDGKGDVVRELADACREAGLKFAVYVSPWDRNHAEYGRPEYITYYRNQLQELLTTYGEIFEVWLDGAYGGNGWYGGANEIRQIDRRTYYEWEETYRLIRQWQPDCVIWNDGGLRGDLRWVGTERGYVGETNWSLLYKEGDVPYEMLHYGVEDGDVFVPAETNTSIRPGWFYHDSENGRVKSLAKLMDTYYKSVGRNSTLLLNFPIDREGLIHKEDSLRGVEFYSMIKSIFDNPIKARKKISKNEAILSFGKPIEFNRLSISENIALGQRVKSFKVEALVEGEWIELHDIISKEPERSMTTIGRKRILCFKNTMASKIKVTILSSKAEPLISGLDAFLAPEIL
ncbi:MAG: alpha-L-fucosidase [Bacteroidales bacterium]|nr:alpha-L-fucosidase [Bacteroidales bacterium]